MGLFGRRGVAGKGAFDRGERGLRASHPGRPGRNPVGRPPPLLPSSATSALTSSTALTFPLRLSKT
jgi:hypothetical protein